MNLRDGRCVRRVAAAAAVALTALMVPAGAANGPSLRVALVQGGDLVVVDLATGAKNVTLRHSGAGPLHWSADRRRVSSAGRIAGGPTLSTSDIAWAPSGETAAYVTRRKGVSLWSPHGSRRLEPDGWGATSLAWSTDGRLAIGRTLYRGNPRHEEIWIWNGRALSLAFSFGTGGPEPYPVTWQGNKVVWWDYPDSASIAADGVSLYVNQTKVGATLMYRDFVSSCGRRLAFAEGGDRFATHGKRIVVGGRDRSRDSSRSWVSPACNAGGTLLVAAAGRNWEEDRFGREHRAIWELLPIRRQLTHPPVGWTDESPQVLADGSILFVRTRQTSRKVGGKYYVTEHAELERLSNRTLKPVANMGYTANVLSALGYANYYGHYGWPSLIAVAP